MGLHPTKNRCPSGPRAEYSQQDLAWAGGTTYQADPTDPSSAAGRERRKAKLCANGRDAFEISKKLCQSSMSREAGLRPGAIVRPAPGPGGSNGFERCWPSLAHGIPPQNDRRAPARRRAHEPKTVVRLMHDHQLHACVTQKNHDTTHSRHAWPVHENVLNHTVTADRLHAFADGTYSRHPHGRSWACLSKPSGLVHPNHGGKGGGPTPDARSRDPSRRPRGPSPPATGRRAAARGSRKPIGFISISATSSAVRHDGQQESEGTRR